AELVINPTEDSVPEVLAYFERRIEELDVPTKIAAKVGVMVDEIYSNIVHYSGATIAKAVCKIEDNSLCVLIKDNGVEYNPLKEEDPDINLSAEERKIGGLGIFMVKNMADEVRYKREDGKNMLKIIINL
ncbi:MAG: ATP-binding protein, partial [Clostridia bacterium]|nr:ATP-binding protein [Clostridia bacterium]